MSYNISNMKLLSQNKIDLLSELVKTSFKMRYQNSALGVLWVLIKPYSQFLVQYVVWTRITNFQIPNYQLYLLLGIIMFTFFNELIILGQMSLLDRAHIILKVSFPRQIAIFSALISAFINLAINMVFFIIIALINNVTITPFSIIYFIFLSIILFIFGVGISFFTSIATIKLRDLKNVFELGMFLLQWLTPIFYSISSNLVEGSVSNYIAANPLGIIINQARAAFGIYGQLNIPLMFAYLIASIIVFVVGWSYFTVKVREIAEYF